mmetsp:Transcript_6775/g.17515  ORF Transcript_6775/g.17515 Transcript_6775/m.17515 type:complete len:211 (-) Transcript_6775:2-634(-)
MASFSSSEMRAHSLFSTKLRPKVFDADRFHVHPTTFFTMMAAYKRRSGGNRSLSATMSRREVTTPGTRSFCQNSSLRSAASLTRTSAAGAMDSCSTRRTSSARTTPLAEASILPPGSHSPTLARPAQTSLPPSRKAKQTTTKPASRRRLSVNSCQCVRSRRERTRAALSRVSRQKGKARPLLRCRPRHPPPLSRRLAPMGSLTKKSAQSG